MQAPKKDASSWKAWIRPARETLADIPQFDFQMHTTWTDGDSTTEEFIEQASKENLKAIGFSEHVNWTSEWYPKFFAEVHDLRRNAPLEIYCGIEVAICDYQGGLKTTPEILNQAEFVMGVVHSYPKEEGGFYRMDELSANQALELELRGLMALSKNPHVDIIGHPGGTYLAKFGEFPVEKLLPVMQSAQDNGIAFELNGKYAWDLEGMLSLLNEVNPLLSIGSDAHHAKDLGRTQRLLRELK